jgi:hypothetical protein
MSTSASEPVNPYASPQIAGGYSPVPFQPGFDGLWRMGNVLVMHKHATLPPICVKSGQPATQWLARKLIWHPPWIALTVLIAIPVYIVIALIMTKRATIVIGLTDEWAARRRTRSVIAVGALLTGVAMVVTAFVLGSQNDIWFVLLLPGIVTGLAAAIYGQYACRLVWPQRITDQYVWLKGVHPNFLEHLPPWP